MIAAATTALLLAYTPSLHPPAIRAARCAPPTLQLDALGDAVKKASSVAGDVAKAAGVDKALENVGSAVGDVAKSASSAVGGKVMEQMGLGNAGLSDEEAKGMEDRLKSGTMTFDDFLVQVKVMQKGASMQAMLGKMGGGQFSKDQIEEGQRKMERCAHAPHTRELSPHTTRTPQLTPLLTPHLCLFSLAGTANSSRRWTRRSAPSASSSSTRRRPRAPAARRRRRRASSASPRALALRWRRLAAS